MRLKLKHQWKSSNHHSDDIALNTASCFSQIDPTSKINKPVTVDHNTNISNVFAIKPCFQCCINAKKKKKKKEADNAT